jgi:hypothetical protein
MPDKVSPLEFAESVKKKYPEYKDYDNIELTNAIIKKYPEYKDYVNMGGPLPAGPKPAPVQGIPTFQEQLPTMQANRFDEAVSKDKKKSGSYIGALYDSFVSAVDPLMYIGDEAFLGAYQYMSGKKLAPQEKQAIRKAVGTTMQIAGARPMKTQDEGVVESIQGGWDLSDGFGSKDLKALGLMGSRVAGDLAIAAASTAVGVPPGSTYFAQGYGSGLQDYNDMVAKGSLEENRLAKQTYALTVGTINGLLEKLAFDKIFGKGPAFDAVKKRVTADILKQVAKSNTKVTMDVVEKVGEQMLKKELSSLGKRGARAGYAAGVEALTEGVQAGSEDLAKLLTNAVQGQQVFDEEDIKKNFIKNVLNSAAAGFALGAPMGIASTMMSNVDNTIVKEIAKAKDETELNSVISELEESMAKSNASEEEIDAMRQSAIKYNSIKQTIPATVSDEAKSNIISLIDRRNGIDEKMSNWQAELEMVDESMKPDVESEMTTLIDAKELINDEIRENASGGKFTYTEDKGKYFKQFEGEDPIEIKKSTYELKKTIENATKKSEGTIQEGGAVSDISEPQGTQEVEDQKTDEANVGYRYIIGEEGDDIPVTALLNKKVRIKGQPAIIYQQGQTVEARIIGTNRIIEIGNVNKLMNELPETFGIETDEILVTETPRGFRVEGQDMVNDNETPTDAINYDKNGKVMNVVLKTTAGKRRKFRGQVAQDLAYQIQLKEILKDEEQFEAFLESEHAQELENARVQAAAQTEAAPVDATVSQQETAEPIAEPTTQPTEPTARPTAEPSVITEPAFGKIVADQPNKIPSGLNRLQRKVVKDALRVVDSIIRPVQDLTGNKPVVNLHNQSTFTEAVIAAGGQQQDADSRGFYLGTDGTIHLNMDNLASDTMLHEGFHPILDFLERYNPEVINNLFTQLESIEGAALIIAQARANYDGDVTQKKEAITDFVAGVADGRIIVNPTNFDVIRKFILDMLNKIGIGKSDLQLMDVENEADLVELANFVTEKFKEGDYISRAELESFTGLPSGYEDASGNPIQSQKIQFSVNNDFSDVKTKTTFTYIKNKQEFEDLKKAGYITEDQVLDNFVGKKFMLHAPDNAFTGEISKNGKTIIEGKGGVFYPIRFHNLGYFWASTKTAANSMASRLNQMIEENGGKIYMALVSSPADKLLSSTTSANGVMEFFASSALDSAVGISKASVSDAIYKAAEKTVQVKKKNSKGVEVNKVVGLGLKIPKTKLVDGVRKPMTLSDIQDAVSRKLGADKSTFEDRKTFSLALIDNMVEKLKGTKSEQILGRFFDKGILNTSFKQQGKIDKKYNLSSTNITQSLSEMLSEPMLKGSQSSQVYAVLEIEGKVKPVESDKHESYPTAIVSEQGGRTKVHILQERENWNDRFADPETGAHVEKGRMMNVFPTSGVSNEPLMLLPKKEPAFQRVAPNGKPSKLTENQYKQVRTPEFKAWFGDWENDPANASKVLDENGEPAVYYHGTPIGTPEFDAFSKGNRKYVFFSPSIDFAESFASGYGRIFPVYINARKVFNPSELSKEEGDKIFNAVQKSYRKELGWMAFPEEAADDQAYRFMDELTSKKDDNWIRVEAPVINDYINKNGYDAIYVREIGVNNIGITDENQVKSATANVGTFSTQDNRIQFQRLAPNGQPSKLNAKQYEQVRTPEFKNWFGDWEANPESASKALDENGEPLVLFHGTKAKFDQFEYNKMSWESRLSQQGPGFYMTDNKKAASQYGKPMNVFTSVKNPLVVDNRSSNITKEQAYKLFSNGDYNWFYEEYLPFFTKSKSLSKEELIKKYVDDMSGVRGFDKEVLQNIKRSYNQDNSYDKMMSDVAGILGKDGVIEKVSDDLSVYVAFTPNQIKSATENVGTFSTQDDRIQFQKGDKLTLRHGGETKIVKFDESKIKGGVRGELGYGYYFSEDTKYKDYGKEVTSIDASSLNIVNENNVVPKDFANKITEWQSKIPEGGFGIGMKAIAGEYIDRIKSEIKANPSITFQDLRRNVNNQYSVDREPMWSNMMSGIGIDGLAAMQGDGTGRSTIRQAVLYPNEKLNSLIIDQPQFQKVTPTKETRKPVKLAGTTIISSKRKATIDNLFTSAGPLGPAIRTFKEQMGGELTAEVNIAERTTKEAMKLMEKYKGIITTQDVENFLSGNAIPSSFPLDLATKLTEMRAHVDRLTDRLLDLNVIDDKETRQLYMNNKGKYLLRSYELFKAKGPVTVENVVKKLKNVDQAKVDAALKVLEQQIKKDQPNLTPQQLKEKAISQANFYLSDEDMAFGGRPIEGSVNAKSLSKRSEYLEDNPAIRALMGEYTDPMYKYYSSIFKLANIASHRDYLNKLKAEGMGKFFFTEATGEATSKIASWETKSLAPLGNLYTFPELKDALMVAEREKKNLLQFLAGHVRIMKTVYNPATHVKNLLGSMAFAVSNGHWMYLGKALSYMKKSKSKELMELIDILNREGVLNNNIGIGEINQYFKKHDNVDDLLKDINLKFNKETAAYLGQKVNVNLKKIPNGLKKLYALEDDIFKVLGFVNETNLYAKAEYGKEFDALNPNEKAKVIKEAAERVKSFYPTFSRVPKFVKGASKAFLVGNFLSFPVESVRVSYNTINQGVKEARSSNPKIRAIGVNRLAGTLLYNGAMTWLLTYASMAAGQGLSGVLGYIFDDEEEIEKREKAKKFRTAWNKDSQVLVNKFSDGKLVYSDMGSIDSYGYQREVWNTFWDNMSNKKGFNKSMAETIAKTVQPYTELDMTVEAILNIMNGRDEFGNDIGNSEAPYSENLKSYTKYISSKFAPGVINSIFKAYRLTQEGDDEAVINEALSQLVRTYTIDLEKSFTNYVYANPGEKNTGETGFKKRLDNAESIYNSVKNSKSMSDSEKEDYYKMAVDAYKNVLRDVSGYYDAAVAGGVDPNKLNQILLRSKLADQRSLPELISIIQNRYDLPDEIYIRR